MSAPIIKRIVESGRTAIGCWQFIAHPDVTSIIGGAGFDFVLLDMEHSGTDLAAARNCIIAADSVDLAFMVRIPERSHSFLIEQILDSGAQGVMVPMIESAEQAEQAVQAVRFPRWEIVASVRRYGLRALGGRVISWPRQ